MRWPWDRAEPPASEPDEHGTVAAIEALDEAMNRWPEVREVTEQIRGIRRRNHLAEITERALRSNR